MASIVTSASLRMEPFATTKASAQPGDTCEDGQCEPGQPLECDDGDVCTEDACDPATGCMSAWVGGPGSVYDCTIGSDVLGHTGAHELSYAMDVTLQDGIAYVGSSQSLDIYGLSKVTQPKLLSRAMLPGAVLSFEVHEEVAYVSIRAGGVVTLDVSDPRAPRLSKGCTRPPLLRA